MKSAKVDSLKVPGASLYYEVRGSGPVLLMIPGGLADASVFQGIAEHLTEAFTLVTYDPRGISRSRLEAPIEDRLFVELFADDARDLLASVGTEPAFVFGTSSGALIGLDLAARHPQHVQMLVAHEPPAIALLPDSPRHRAAIQDVHDTYRRSGIGPAMQKFMVFSGLAGEGAQQPRPSEPQPEPTPEAAYAMAQMQRNMDFFLGQYVLAITTYEPNIAALKASPTRIVAGVGEDSRGNLAQQGGLALAERLGAPAVVFPGDHGGYMRRPREFAATLRNVLGS
jgi:pimeloyl-ACP methyl ester carboxylesterase